MIFTFLSKSEFSKDFKLKDQINGSSGSVMDNIAEGFGRGSRKEFIQFLGIAKGSLDEVKSQLYRCLDRNYISQSEFEIVYKLTEDIGKRIHGFIKYLNTSETSGLKFKNRVKEPLTNYGSFHFDE